MQLGAFAGGVTKGYEVGTNLQQNQQKIDLAKNEDDRRQAEADYQQTQRERELRIQQKLSAGAKQLFGDDQQAAPAAAIPSAAQPTDQSGAVVANDTNPPVSVAPSTADQGSPDTGIAKSAIPPQAVPPSTAVAHPVDTTTPAPPPNAAPAPAMQASAPSALGGGQPAAPQGVDLMRGDFPTQSKFANYQTFYYKTLAEEGALKPEELQKYQEYAIKMQQNGTAQAFKAFLAGDTGALDQIAAKNGVKGYSFAMEQGPDGLPHQVIKVVAKDGTVTTQPTAVMAAAMGASDVSAAAEKSDDNKTKQALIKAQAQYYSDHGTAVIENSRAANRRADAAEKRAENASKQPEGFDGKYASEEFSKAPFYVPSTVGGILPTTPTKDSFALGFATDKANELMSDGGSPPKAVSTAREIIQRANDAASQAVDANGKPMRFKDQAAFDRFRMDFIKKAGLGLQKPTAATKQTSALPTRPASSDPKQSSAFMAAVPKNGLEPDAPKGRSKSIDQRQIFSQELNEEKRKLDNETDPVEIARINANIKAIQRELINLRS